MRRIYVVRPVSGPTDAEKMVVPWPDDEIPTVGDRIELPDESGMSWDAFTVTGRTFTLVTPKPGEWWAMPEGGSPSVVVYVNLEPAAGVLMAARREA